MDKKICLKTSERHFDFKMSNGIMRKPLIKGDRKKQEVYTQVYIYQ